MFYGWMRSSPGEASLIISRDQIGSMQPSLEVLLTSYLCQKVHVYEIEEMEDIWVLAHNKKNCNIYLVISKYQYDNITSTDNR
jgi:hypothetical protein